MKKAIAILLCFAAIFALAACKNNQEGPQETTTANTETTTAEPTGKPGDFVTDKSGNLQTTVNSYIIPDKNNEPKTEIVTDNEGGTKVEIVTTQIIDYETYPGAPEVPTVAPGNTKPSTNKKWPEYAFLNKLPKFSSEVDNTSYSKNDKGEIIVIYINDADYKDFTNYVEKCKAAGFTQTAGHNPLPSKEVDGESYIYYSATNGLWVSVEYYTNSAPYRNCDIQICVTNYDIVG